MKAKLVQSLKFENYIKNTFVFAVLPPRSLC